MLTTKPSSTEESRTTRGRDTVREKVDYQKCREAWIGKRRVLKGREGKAREGKRETRGNEIKGISARKICFCAIRAYDDSLTFN